MTQPSLDVLSAPAMPERDRLAYLLLGRPRADSASDEQPVLQQAALALGVEGGAWLADRIGGRLGVDDVRIASEVGDATEDAVLLLGKYLSPDLYVSYGCGGRSV